MRKFLVAGVFAVALFVVVSPLKAEDTTSTTPTPQSSASSRKEIIKDFIQERKDARQDLKIKLTDAKLRSCQARESSIKNRMEALTRLVSNIEDKFASIAKRVENFYSSSGKTIANYDSLVAAISTAKTQVDTDLTTAQTDASAFSCTTGDPKGLLTQFRTDMQKVKEDLKTYRTSIKNLIIAVRPLAGSPEPEESEKPKASESPEPSASP